MKYLHDGFYLLRSPYGTVNDIINNYSLYNSIEDFEKFLISVFNNPDFRKALYVASAGFYYQFDKFIHQPDKTAARDRAKLLKTLFKYWIRMGTRCTPFGLFAGVSVGTIGSYTDIALGDPAKNYKHTRLDMAYLVSLIEHISNRDPIKDQLKYFPNNSIYTIGNKLHYIEYTLQNELRRYQLSTVDRSAYLETILSKAKSGGTIHELAGEILSDDISIEDAKYFIHELIRSQLLIAELEPGITGDQSFETLIEKLKTLQHVEDTLEKLTLVAALLKKQDNEISGFETCTALASSLVPSYKGKSIFQTDLHLATDANCLNEKVVDEIKDQILALWKIADFHDDSDLEDFKKMFYERYELQEIPLAHAIDGDFGIGYGTYTSSNPNNSALTHGLFPFLPGPNSTKKQRTNFNIIRDMKYYEAIANNAAEIRITQEDLDVISGDIPLIPNSFYIQGQLLRGADSGGPHDFSFLLQKCAGPSGVNTITRFCHGDERLARFVKDFIKQEECMDDEHLYAEVVHLPQARNGNILQRPDLRDFELVYLGSSSIDDDKKIYIDDLLVGIQNGVVYLRSKKFGKRVIPRLTTAHNFTGRNLPVYKFLCDLQFQYSYKEIAWNWGTLKNNSFLPRVRFGNIILKRATWNIDANKQEELRKLVKVRTKSSTEWIQAIVSIKAKLNLPRYVTISNDDNDLLLDLENEWCLNVLAENFQKEEITRICACEYSPEKCFITSQSGNHTNEIVIPVIKDVKPPAIIKHPAINRMEVNNTGDIKRSFIPGEEWSYFKIYCGINAADNILREVILPLSEYLISEGIIEKWFYIRFADPDNHLRIRFYHKKDITVWQKIQGRLEEMVKYYLDNNIIYKIQIDTYKREIERYGAAFITLSEDIFFRDSEAVLKILNEIGSDADERMRWLIGTRAVDMLLNDFEFNLSEKLDLLEYLSKKYWIEFGQSKLLAQQLNEKYRTHSKEIASFMNKANDRENNLEAVINILNCRSSFIHCTHKIMKHNKHYAEARKHLTSSYIHMFIFRILKSNFRKNELVLYHLLAKYYSSQIAQVKYEKTQ